MKIVVAVRCYNEERNIERFLNGYSFADKIIVSDGGSTDRSLEILALHPEIDLLHFEQFEIMNEVRWNPDNPHINFVLNAGKALNPDWLIFDDMDDVPNYALKKDARKILENSSIPQVNAFRLYMWGDKEFFPKMNGYGDRDYKSLWAWKPSERNIRADENIRHGTIIGIGDFNGLNLPYCLLHRSWQPETINAKVKRYNDLDLPMSNPAHGYFGEHLPLPEYARENE